MQPARILLFTVVLLSVLELCSQEDQKGSSTNAHHKKSAKAVGKLARTDISVRAGGHSDQAKKPGVHPSRKPLKKPNVRKRSAKAQNQRQGQGQGNKKKKKGQQQNKKSKQRRRPRVNAAMRAKFRQCRTKTKATKKDIKAFKRRQIPRTKAGKCLLACMFEATGMIRAGKYSTKGMMAVARKAYRKNNVKFGRAKQLIQSCGQSVNAKNKCDLAYNMVRCAVKESAKLRL